MQQHVTELNELWSYRDQSSLGANVVDTHADITGFSVEAIDGSIGKVNEVSYNAGGSYVVVDTGPWIFGHKVMLPAGIVRGIDEMEEIVFVNRTKEQIKSAPEYDESFTLEDTYRSDLETYYGSGGAGYRDWDDTF